MSLELKIANTCDFEGNTYSIPIEMILSDRVFREFDYNYQEMGEIVPFSTAYQNIYDTFGYNPFSKLTFYSTNFDSTWDTIPAPLMRWINELGANVNVIISEAGSQEFTNYTVNETVLNFRMGGSPGVIRNENLVYCDDAIGLCNFYVYISSTNSYLIEYSFSLPSQHMYDHGEWNEQAIYNFHNVHGQIRVSQTAQGHYAVSRHTQTTSEGIPAGWGTFIHQLINANPEDIVWFNPNDPFDTGSPSTPAGGDGDYQNAEKSDPIDFPDLPDIDAVSSGLITIYAPSLSQIQSLGDFLWSDLFDINTLKKLFADPMSALIGLGIVPVTPTLAGSKTVKFGNTSTGVIMPYLASQFVTKDMGSVKVSKYVGSFMDFDYSQVQIYLPYIGIRNLDVHDVMGCTLTLKYQIDVLTGGCAAMISVSGKGVLYQFNGSCIANVPLTANNYSTAIQNAISSVISGGATIAGALTGAAPLTVAGAAGLATSAANTAVSAKSPSIERSGSMGGAAGLLAVQQPYVIIERPNFSIPKNLNSYTGNMLNVTLNLATAVGFTMIDYIHLDNIPCTEPEREELLSLLKQGVIF